MIPIFIVSHQGYDGEWESEDSFLVLGISLEGAQELGAAYGQNAIVWCGEDAIPKLVLLM